MGDMPESDIWLNQRIMRAMVSHIYGEYIPLQQS